LNEESDLVDKLTDQKLIIDMKFLRTYMLIKKLKIRKEVPEDILANQEVDNKEEVQEDILVNQEVDYKEEVLEDILANQEVDDKEEVVVNTHADQARS